MKVPYPDRESFFSNRAVRLMRRCGVAEEIGADAAWLLTVVASAEDERRYARPVLMSNDQLQTACGFRSTATLIRTRQRAIDAGWLHYQPGHKGKVGVYWVLIPAYAESLETGAVPADAEEDRENTVQEVKRKRQGKRSESAPTSEIGSGFTSRFTSRGEEKATHLIPCIPNPNPNEIPAGAGISSEDATHGGTAGADGEPLAVFPCVGDGPKEWGLTPSKLAEWSETYPGMDVLAESRKALQWCRDNPTRRKTARGMPKFLGDWLRRSQDSGRFVPRAGPAAAAGHAPRTPQGRDLMRGHREFEELMERANGSQAVQLIGVGAQFGDGHRLVG